MLAQFYLQNLHFALNIFVAMVMSWCFWLYLDVWMPRKTISGGFKVLGFFLLTFSFLVHAFNLETTILTNSFLPDSIYKSSLLASRILGYLFISLGLLMEPSLPNPLKTKNSKKTEDSKLNTRSNLMLSAGLPSLGLKYSVLGVLSLPIIAAATGLLFLYKATIGLEFHLRRVALAFFGLSLYELLSTRELFTDSSNVSIFRLVAPFGIIWWAEHITLILSSLLLAKWVFGYLLKRLQSQLYIFFSMSILFIFIASTLSFTSLLLGNIEKEALNQIEVNAKVLIYSLEGKKEELASDTLVFSKDSKVIEAIAGDQKSNLAKLASSYLVDKKLSFLVITNDKGQVIARGEETERVGDSLSSNSLVKRALVGKPASSITVRDGVLSSDILVTSAFPVAGGGGVIYSGSAIDNAFLDGINKATGLASSIYGSNQISATTLTAEDGTTRRIGLVETNKKITSKVLGLGENFVGASDFLNTPYFSAYLPLKDVDNTNVGMLFVGKPQITVLSTAGRSIQASFVIAGILWLLAAIPSFLISGFISKQLK